MQNLSLYIKLFKLNADFINCPNILSSIDFHFLSHHLLIFFLVNNDNALMFWKLAPDNWFLLLGINELRSSIGFMFSSTCHSLYRKKAHNFQTDILQLYTHFRTVSVIHCRNTRVGCVISVSVWSEVNGSTWAVWLTCESIRPGEVMSGMTSGVCMDSDLSSMLQRSSAPSHHHPNHHGYGPQGQVNS